MYAIYRENLSVDLTLNVSSSTYTIVFDGNTATSGSTSSQTCKYNEDCVLNANGFAKTGYHFVGWSDASDSAVLYDDEDTVRNLAFSGTYTLYAIWAEDSFLTVWSQMGACTFTGTTTTGNVSGSECQAYAGNSYIDTGIALYSQANYQKDYEVHFTIDHYVASEQAESQSTLFNDKLSTSTTTDPYNGKAPGIIVRRNSSRFEIKSTYGRSSTTDANRDISKSNFSGTDIRIFRIDGVIYTSVDNGPLVVLQDYNDFDQQFGLTAWFGAYPTNVNCSENCTAAKRYFTGVLSNMYIKMGEFPADGLHSITFDTNGGTITTGGNMLIADGDSLGTLPTATRTNYVFDAWQDSNQQNISASTVPHQDETYTAHWTKAVTLATFANNLPISVQSSGSATIVVSNSGELEPYTFRSDDTSIVTVNANTGVITAVTPGSTTITMSGTRSGLTKTINVTVEGTIYTVHFDAGAGSAVSDVNVGEGGSINPLPISTNTGYKLDGWYTGPNGTGTKLTTTTVFTSNTPTQYYAYWVEPVLVCKIATELHQETCSRTSATAGCRNAGFALNETITYGNLVESTTMNYGDAYDCDIDDDGLYGEKVGDKYTERFYYIGSSDGVASLVYYKDEPAGTNLSYTDASSAIPDRSVWNNPDLVSINDKVSRFMTVNEVTTICGGNSQIGYKVADTSKGKCGYIAENSRFAYESTSGMLNTIWLQQVNGANRRVNLDSGQNIQSPAATSVNGPRPVIEVPLSLIEVYTPPILSYNIDFQPHNGEATTQVTITAGDTLGNNYPNTDPVFTDHLFQGWYTATSGGTLVTSATQPEGDSTYHAQWLGTVALAQIDNTNISLVEGNTATISVNNASDIEAYTLISDDTSIATVNSNTGVVSAEASGSTTITMTGVESHTTRTINVTVHDPSSSYTIYFDPHNGSSATSMIINAGSSIGTLPAAPAYANHVFQGWFKSASGGTAIDGTEVPNDGDTYHAQWKLDVTQAIISNNDLTVPATAQITIEVNNSAALEPYSFSSANDSIATVSASTGVVTGMSAGTVNITMTGSQSGLTKILEVDVTALPAIMRQVTFNANGGQSVSGVEVEDGTAIGTLPTTTRTNYRFFGWYTDDNTFYTEVTPETVVDADVTYYARWVEDTTSFPIVWAETNACSFHDNSANISGDYCTQDKTMKYIDTAVALFSTANYQKDFEIGFTIVEFDPAATNQQNQATFVNSKRENKETNYPGFVVRRNSGSANIELTGKFSHGNPTDYIIAASSLKRMRIARQNGVLKYAINDASTFTTWYDVTNNTHRIDTNVWFGAAVTSNDVNAQRHLIGTLTDMYIRLQNSTDYVITFEPNGGTTSELTRSVPIGDQVGQLPEASRSGSYTFDGWYNESNQLVSATDTPTRNETYTAHWTYNSSNVPVVFDVSNNATRGYQNIINVWTQSPYNITTFNKASPINSSTWGDTSELTEVNFWSTLKNNFETYSCSKPSYGDAATTTVNPTAWTNGSTDCSKPDAYDTSINAALNVYLNNNQGEQVTYAKASSGIIYNMIPGQTYYWEKADDSTVYGYVTATSTNGVRWLNVGTMRNIRDLGGLPADTDGDGTIDGTLKYGKIIRGERIWNSSTNATELANLGIDKEYDLSDGTELASDSKLSQYQLDSVIHYNFAYNSGDENNSSSNYMKAWQAVTDIMTDVVANKDIFFHCRVGADRTGTIAYLLEGLLGVPNEARYQEYELTHLSGLTDRTRYYKQKSSSNNLKFVFMMDYLSTTASIYDWYMSNPNADPDLISDFQSAMVESSAP